VILRAANFQRCLAGEPFSHRLERAPTVINRLFSRRWRRCVYRHRLAWIDPSYGEKRYRFQNQSMSPAQLQDMTLIEIGERILARLLSDNRVPLEVVQHYMRRWALVLETECPDD
jgi:hypothetical protein